jgi:membrane protein implicated in regulation of membrane protease activity
MTALGVTLLIIGAMLVLVLVAVGVVAVSLRGGLEVRRRQIRGGAEGLIGHCGVVQKWMEPSGKVLVDGALWHARHSWGDDQGAELHAGDPVVVERISGLTLGVRRAEEWEL